MCAEEVGRVMCGTSYIEIKRGIRMKEFLKFLTKLRGFWKIYSGYGYDGETVEFIIENYTIVLETRTRLMSKPTYYARDVIAEIDKWYEDLEELKNEHGQTHNK